jgi:hypothetical protein
VSDGRLPADDVTLTIRPQPRSAIAGANARMSRIEAMTCSSHWPCQSSSVSSSSPLAKLVPALLTRMSGPVPPSRSAICSAASGAVTSIPSLRETASTVAPSASSRRTVSAPIPRLAPVTTALRPLSPRSMRA